MGFSYAAPQRATRDGRAQSIRYAPAGAAIRSNQALLRRIQPKLVIGATNDPLERQADAASDAVVAGRPVPSLHAAAFGAAQRKCDACEQEEATLQRKVGSLGATSVSASDAAAAAVSGGGRSLSASEIGYFGPRFGRDFSSVRVHEHAAAQAAADGIRARAYTLGRNIAFAPGQYAPHTAAGRRLMAHELAHTVQQSGGSETVSRRVIQRACGEKQIGEVEVDPTGMHEAPGDPGVTGALIRFRVGCDEFLTPDEGARLRDFATLLPARSRIVVHGFASEEGPLEFNRMLSVARAAKVRDILSGLINPIQLEDVVWHGPVPGNRPDRRAVVIETRSPLPPINRSLTIVSWINPAGLPSFSYVAPFITPHGYVESVGACMAIRCTANTPPPDTLPDSDLPGFLASKQYRAVQTFEITHYPNTSAGDTVIARQVLGYTAPSSCWLVPPKTFTQGEASPLNHVDVGRQGDDTTVNSLMKIRVSTAEETAAVDKATSFPMSILTSRSRVSHIPWVWSEGRLQIDAHTGKIRWFLRVSAFPTNTVYLDGKKVAEIPQGGCSVVLDPRFRNIDLPRESLDDEAKQANVPVPQQDETVSETNSAAGEG